MDATTGLDDGSVNQTIRADDATSNGEIASSNNVEPVIDLSQELPFLVTNWLAQFGTQSQTSSSHVDSEIEGERTAALARIHRAASDLAVAFASLGSFGTAIRVSL